ncbi:MAG: hypothetical protein WBM24_24175 [Candidatus Sulfotelmatobacter sp.]
MIRKLGFVAVVALSGLIFVAPGVAQDAAWRVDSQHSTARLFLASSTNSEASINVGVARVSGTILRNTADTTLSNFDFTVYPADKTAASEDPASDPEYTVIRFKSKSVVPVNGDTVRVAGDLTLTHIERIATYESSEDYAGPVYGPAVTNSVSEPAVFEFHRVSAGARTANLSNTEWSASSTTKGEDFPELLNAVSTIDWPTLVEDEKCTTPLNAGEGFSGPACTGTTVEVAARTDVQCEAPSAVGEDFAGEVCMPTRQRKGDPVQFVANEVRIQLDFHLTRTNVAAAVSSGQ